ncbi:hypothetical protein [Loigolactobacillus jiayinensis]|uniref:Uncharacterized protein n=1 Tax=Loigolactobacillus jiayinensis TaxID=2486016 RepID=A0ABW1RFI1_9LACO|nr:hypothetical protein [Loigolactobacillus jiayinensis]
MHHYPGRHHQVFLASAEMKHWRITLTLCDGLLHKEIYDVELSAYEPVGFDHGWFYIGHSFAVAERLVIGYKIENLSAKKAQHGDNRAD